jgi:hypothetical protein
MGPMETQVGLDCHRKRLKQGHVVSSARNQKANQTRTTVSSQPVSFSVAYFHYQGLQELGLDFTLNLPRTIHLKCCDITYSVTGSQGMFTPLSKGSERAQDRLWGAFVLGSNETHPVNPISLTPIP